MIPTSTIATRFAAAVLCAAAVLSTDPSQSGAVTESLMLAITDPSGQTYQLETKDGILTATLPDRTDDAALAAAIPQLLADHVEGIVLRAAAIQDVRPLTLLTDLRTLDLAGSQVRDIGPLASFKKLQTLNLQFLRLYDLKPLAGMTALRVLNIGGTEVRDLSPLAAVANLRELMASVTKIRDLTPLASLHQLVALDLGGTSVSNLKALTNTTSLRVLNLNGAPVDDLTPIAGLINLETLDLGGTQVSDIHTLAGLGNLRSVNLEGTQVADVSPLARLPALRTVALGGSLVHDKSPLAHLAAASGGRPNNDRATPDPVLFWNDQTNRSIQATAADPFFASRALAIESITVLDALKSLDGQPAFLVRLPPPPDIPANLVIDAAAHAILVHLFPSRRAPLDAALNYAIANEPDARNRAQAIAFGKAMATSVIMRREEDGSMAHGTTRIGSAPGQWRPTPPDFLPAMHPQWAEVEPFALTAPSQFRPAGPPPLDSDAFRQATAKVASLGGSRSTERTAEQTEIAKYWSDSIGTYAPAGHWNAIATNIVGPLHLGLSVEAELFAELNVAIADAGVAMADAKYTYWSWRPVTAIRTGTPGRAAVPDWLPLLETPNHPSYVSGHSAFSAAAAVVMTTWFGNRPFTFSSASLPGVTRSFSSFDQAAEEAAVSRVYGGIHFPFDNADGVATGRSVGHWVMGVFQRLEQDRGPFLMTDQGMGMAPKKNDRSLSGCALDNLLPVAAITATIDGGSAFSVPVDENGLFSIPGHRFGIGRHDVSLAATSASGRISSIQVTVE